MNWYFVVLHGMATVRFVSPGCDESEAISYARDEYGNVVDVKHVECDAVTEEEAGKLNEIAGIDPEDEREHDHSTCETIIADLAEKGITLKSLGETVYAWREPANAAPESEQASKAKAEKVEKSHADKSKADKSSK